MSDKKNSSFISGNYKYTGTIWRENKKLLALFLWEVKNKQTSSLLMREKKIMVLFKWEVRKSKHCSMEG